MLLFDRGSRNVILATLVVLCLTPLVVVAGPAEDTALRNAALKLDRSGVTDALSKGANPNAVSSDPRPLTPLSAVTMGLVSARVDDREEGAIEVANILFFHGAKIGPFDRGLLFFPIAEGNSRLVELLLDKGASPTKKIEGYTPTELALKYSHRDVYELLISRGGIPVTDTSRAQLLFVEAASRSDIAGMEGAIEDGAALDGVDVNGRTALVDALRVPILDRQRAEAVGWLLDRGADPNKKGDSGFQGLEGIPLHIFVAMNALALRDDPGRPEVAELAEETLSRLLKAGAKVSGMDSRRRTPLHLAAESDNLRAAEILIRTGARVMARDREGRTPLDYAESAEIIELLKSSGAAER